MEPLDLTGVKEYAPEIAQPLRDRLVGDICRGVKEAGALATTAEYEIYRAEQLGLAEKEIKAAMTSWAATAGRSAPIQGPLRTMHQFRACNIQTQNIPN